MLAVNTMKKKHTLCYSTEMVLSYPDFNVQENWIKFLQKKKLLR